MPASAFRRPFNPMASKTGAMKGRPPAMRAPTKPPKVSTTKPVGKKSSRPARGDGDEAD